MRPLKQANVIPAQAGIHVWCGASMDPAPRLREDKLRGDDVLEAMS